MYQLCKIRSPDVPPVHLEGGIVGMPVIIAALKREIYSTTLQRRNPLSGALATIFYRFFKKTYPSVAAYFELAKYIVKQYKDQPIT